MPRLSARSCGRGKLKLVTEGESGRQGTRAADEACVLRILGNAGVDRAADSSPQAECPITRTNYIQTPTTDVIDAMEKFEELLKTGPPVF